jgi:excisionase family DNA binding protein
MPTSSTPVPLTIEAAAERLGVTPRLVRRLVTERRIGFVRVGKFIRLRQEDLDAYLDEHFVPPLERRATR